MAMESLAIIILVLAVLLIAGVPISYAIGISALAAIVQMVSLDVSVLTAAQRTFVGMSKFSLTAIPFFVLAGNLMNQGGCLLYTSAGRRSPRIKATNPAAAPRISGFVHTFFSRTAGRGFPPRKSSKMNTAVTL